MSFQSLQERLAALQETTASLSQLISRLASLRFEPGSVPLAADDEDSPSGELGAEIAQALRDGEEEQELLREEVECFRGARHDRERLRDGAEGVVEDLARCRLAFRRARLAAKKNLAQAQRLERDLLIKSYTQPVSGRTSPHPDSPSSSPAVTVRKPQPSHDHAALTEEDQHMVGASTSVTSALRQTHALIASELERSEYAHQTLVESSAALRRLDESYASLGGLLASSRDLLGTLLRSQKSDTWYLQTAFYLLLATAGWLVFRRLLYGPAWWLVWLPVRLLFGTGVRVGGAVMHGIKSPEKSGQVVGQRDAQDGRVEGLPSQDLPTMVVDQDKARETPGSVQEEIDKIVNTVAEAEDLGNIPEAEAKEARNTKKRMWEETEGAVEDRRPKDEL